MTPLSRWIRNRVERFLDRYYEGPEPPQRIGEAAIEFANRFPHATRADWVTFAAEQAREAWKAGYIRGVEYVERDPDWHPSLPPDIAADLLSADWRDGRGISLQGDSSFVVPENLEQNTLLQKQMEMLAKQEAQRGRE